MNSWRGGPNNFASRTSSESSERSKKEPTDPHSPMVAIRCGVRDAIDRDSGRGDQNILGLASPLTFTILLAARRARRHRNRPPVRWTAEGASPKGRAAERTGGLPHGLRGIRQALDMVV